MKAATPAGPGEDLSHIELRKIRLDMGTQSRAALQPAGVQDYAELLAEVRDMPPVVVYPLGRGYYILASGFHRCHAYRRAGRAVIPAIIRQGDVHDARDFSAGCNIENALRRTREDCRAAVGLILGDPVLFVGRYNRNNSAIAAHCGVSEFLVRSMREDEEEDGAGGEFDAIEPGPLPPLPPGTDQEDAERAWRQVPRSVQKLRKQCRVVGIAPEEALAKFPWKEERRH